MATSETELETEEVKSISFKDVSSKGLTLAQLKALVDKLVKEGHGNKYVLLTDDDEENGYHTAFKGIYYTENNNAMESMLEYEQDCHEPGECVIIG